jgi:hypothetical protein
MSVTDSLRSGTQGVYNTPILVYSIKVTQTDINFEKDRTTHE